MAWRRPGDKPLSEPMMVCLPTHICVARPQWVKLRKCASPNVKCFSEWWWRFNKGGWRTIWWLKKIHIYIYIYISVWTPNMLVEPAGEIYVRRWCATRQWRFTFSRHLDAWVSYHPLTPEIFGHSQKHGSRRNVCEIWIHWCFIKDIAKFLSLFH